MSGKPFPVYSSVYGKAKWPTVEWNTWKVLHSRRLGKASALPANMRLSWNSLQGTYILAFIEKNRINLYLFWHFLPPCKKINIFQHCLQNSCLPTLVNYRDVKFYNIGPTIEVDIRNKHTSLLNYGKKFFSYKPFVPIA